MGQFLSSCDVIKWQIFATFLRITHLVGRDSDNSLESLIMTGNVMMPACYVLHTQTPGGE